LNFSALQHEADGLSAGLPPLMVEADHLAASVSLGVHGRRRAGMGESFWQFRRYASHDSAAAIDWRQSARSSHIFVREREWEAAQTVWFWRDGSPGMAFRSGNVSKRGRSDLLVLALAALLVRGGERVGFLGMDDGPAASRLALTRIGRALMRPAGEALPPHRPLARASQLVWFSDFLEPSAIDTIHRLAREGIIGHLVRVVDPAEEDFPYSGRTRFESPRGGEDEVFGRAERVREAYRTRFAAHGEEIARTATKLGWSATVHRTDHAPQGALIALHAAIGGG
jgi:uncharacterized protein (DUF58 family)